MKNTLKKLKGRRYGAAIAIVILLVFVVGLVSLLKPIIKNIDIKRVLTKTTSLNASVIDGISEGVSSNNYDEIKYQLKVNKNDSDEAIIIGTLTDKENKYARFKEIKDSVVSENGKKITVTTTRSKVTITVIISNAPYGTTINPKFNINSTDENKSRINVDPVTITGKSVEGKVYDENGTYYKGLELSLKKNDEEIKRTYTRDDGEYVFSLGDTDRYSINLEEEKYSIVRYSEETTDDNKRVLNIVIKEIEPFNVEIKKTISKLDLIVNGKKETYNYNDETKVVRSMKNAKAIEGSIYYNISIKNTGEIKGTLTVLKDRLPEGLSFDESKNPGWTKDGDYLFYTVIEDKEIGPYEKINASLVLDIIKTNEAKNYINKAIAGGEDYKYVTYYLNNRIFKEEYVASLEKIENINPNVDNFEGWYTDKNFTNKYDFNNTVIKDIVLFGKINNNKYSVTFMDRNPNNGNETIIDIKEVDEGTPVDLISSPSYDGYTFKCFELNNRCYDNEEITEDTILYTKYTTNVYDIIYHLDGGIVSTANPSTYTVKDEITINNPSKEGFTFTGWTGTDLTDKVIDLIIPRGSIGNREFTANYEINKSTLTIDPNGGTYLDNASTVSFTENYGTVKQIEESEKRGYIFRRYDHTGGGSFLNGLFTFDNDDTTLTAIYEINTYSITYNNITDAERSSLNNPISYNVETNTFTLNNPETRKDTSGNNSEDFLGWDDGNGNVSINVTIEKGSIGNRTYTAVWRENQDDYAITYILNGGTLSEPNPSTYRRSTNTFTLNNPSKSGYTFKGWTGTDLSDYTTTVTIEKGSAGDRSYTANYDIIPYTISYNGLTNEELNLLNNPTGYNVETNTITLNNPSRTGYIFTGWSGTDIADKSTSVVIPKGSIGNRAYTANFEKAEYSLTYTLNGGTLEPGKTNPTKYSIESADITLNNPSKEGYTFTGWSGTDLVGNNNMTVTIPTGSIGHRSYLANYEPIVYTLTYDYDGGSLEPGVTNPSAYTIETPDITLNNPSKEGYVFKNYTINGVIVTGIPAGSTGNKTLKANYEIRKYNVNYYNESTLFGSDEVDWNTTTTAPSTIPTKNHNIFLYWSEDGVNEYDFSTLITEDKNLYAVYEEVLAPSITIEPILDLDTNRTWVCNDSTNADCGVTVAVTSDHPEYELYYKIGEGSATLYTAPFKVYENITVTAWSKKSNINSISTENTITNVDSIAPTINNPGTGAMSFNMTVSGTAQDAGSGVKKFTLFAKEKDALVYDDNLTYESEIFDGIKDHAENYDHTFYGVKDNTEYIVLIRAEDYVGNISEREVEVTTHPYVARVVGKNGILWYSVDPDTKEFILDEGKEFLLFDSIQSAVDYCAEVQCTIQTNPILPVVNENVTIGANQDITIDLDGRTIVSNGNATFNNNGRLQIVDRNPRMDGTEHDGIGKVINTEGKAILNNNIFVLGEGSSEASATFIIPELDRPIIEGYEAAIEQNNLFFFFDGELLSDTITLIDNGEDPITQYSYNIAITGDGQKHIGTLSRVSDPEARIKSTYYLKLNINNADDAFSSSRKGTLDKEKANMLSRIKQYGDYGFIYDEVNDEIYNGNGSTTNTTAISYLKIDLTDYTEDQYITFDTFIDTMDANTYGYISVNDSLDSTGTIIYKTTGNDVTGTKIHALSKGKVHYLFFGFVKGGNNLNKYETFKVTSLSLLGDREFTTDINLVDDVNNYKFVKQADGSFKSNNQGVRNSYAHSYALIDLTNETEPLDLLINTDIGGYEGQHFGYIYVSDKADLQSHDVETGRYVHTTGEHYNETYTVPLTPGKINYVHFVFYKNNYDPRAQDAFTINSIAFKRGISENILPETTMTHNSNDNYYFEKMDYEPFVWKDTSSNHNNVSFPATFYVEDQKGFRFSDASYGIIENSDFDLTDYEESVYVEFKPGANYSDRALYHGSTNERIAIYYFSGQIIVSNYQNTHTYHAPASFTDGNKHSLLVTYKDNAYTAYFDGTELQFTNDYNWVSTTNTNTYIGRRANGNNHFNGMIYNVKVFNKQLTPEELDNEENLVLNLDGEDALIPSDSTVYMSNNTYIPWAVAHSYLTYDLTDIDEDKFLYVNTLIDSEPNNDVGYVQVTNSTSIPASNTSTSRLINISGVYDNQSAIIRLKKNQVNYVHFVFYHNDGYVFGANDRFVIKDIRVFDTPEEAHYIDPSGSSKINQIYFDKPILNDKVDTIEMLKDITLDSNIVVPQEREVVLDLNGFTLTSNKNDYIIKNNGKLTIIDSAYEDKINENINYKLEQARLFEAAGEQYLADKAEYEEYAGLCDGCELSEEYKLDHLIEYLDYFGFDIDTSSSLSIEEIDYSGAEEEYEVNENGIYKLEVWGAQGGSNPYTRGGYGGYSVGYTYLTPDDKLYINVGGQGTGGSTSTPGYNGGGIANHAGSWTRGAGGGATHIAKSSGLLSTLESNKKDLLIVAAGGGGAGYYNAGQKGDGGDGGGYIGNSGTNNSTGQIVGTGGTQTEGGTGRNTGSFGQGANRTDSGSYGGSGGGGGYYGGGACENTSGGGGGSGFIGTSNLIDKKMVCFNCQTSDDINTKTETTECNDTSPTSDCAKQENGYAKITKVAVIDQAKIDEIRNNLEKTYNVRNEPKFINYLDGIDFDGTININQLTPESTPTYNDKVVESRDGNVTSTITNAILNEEYATLLLKNSTINVSVNGKNAVENRGTLIVDNAIINANNANTVGIFNESNGELSFDNGAVINVIGTSSVGILNRSSTQSIDEVKVVTTQANSIGVRNEAVSDIVFNDLDISGAGLGFREYSIGNTVINNSSIKSTGTNAFHNVSQTLENKLEINNTNINGRSAFEDSAKVVNVNNSTLTTMYNLFGTVNIYDSNLQYIDNRGNTVIDKSTITGPGNIIYNYARGVGYSESSNFANLLIKDSTINSTSTNTNDAVIINYDTLTASNITANNINGVKSTLFANYSYNYDSRYYNRGPEYGYLNIPTTMNIDPSFGAAFYNAANLTIGSERGNVETEYNFAYTGHQEEFVVPADGLYKLETWGAAAAGSYIDRVYDGGLGGYVSGVKELHQGDKLYIHVGGTGSGGVDSWISKKGWYDNYDEGFYGAYNGGYPIVKGSYWGYLRTSGSGGGATDISLSNEDNTWSYDNGVVTSRRSAASYAQRIIVAGGGSGCGGTEFCYGGYSIDPSTSQLGYATQSGAGGGYYGGITSYGGSSYASDILSDVVYKNGNEEMPNYNDGVMKGNRGSGYARITLITDDMDSVTESPVISATNYGISGPGRVRFLDGTINANVALNTDVELVPDNYDIYNSKDENNKEKIILVNNDNSRPVPSGEEEFVAKIGNAKYTTIQKALDASNNGDTIELLTNIEQQNKLVIPSTMRITIDYKGHTVKSYNPDCLFENHGDLTITDSVNNKGKNTFTGDKYISNDGILNLSKIYIDNQSFTVNLISNDGTITMNDVKLDFGNPAIEGLYAITNSENGTITVNNSSINLWRTNNFFDNKGMLTISNSAIHNDDYSVATVVNAEFGTVILDGNTLTVAGHDDRGRYILNNAGTATVKNMTSHIEDINNTGSLILEGNNIPSGTVTSTGLVTINDGTYKNIFNINSPGISIDSTDKLYSLIMHDGTINTTLNTNSTGISSIEGGTINVTSGYAINNTGSGVISLGIKDGTVLPKESTEPIITGKTYGIFTRNPALLVDFYDGIVSGNKAYNVTVREIETGYSIRRDHDSANDIESKYLTNEPMFENITHAAQYATVDEFNTALSNGSIVNDDVIKVYRDITISNNDSPITIPQGLNITFDINGKVVDKNNSSMFINNGELIMIDSVNDSTGNIDSTIGNIAENNGTLNINSGTFISEKASTETEVIKNNDGATLNISGGSFTKYYDWFGQVLDPKGAVIYNVGSTTVTGGKFYTNASYSENPTFVYSSMVFNNRENGTLIVTGGEYDGITGYTVTYDGTLTSVYTTHRGTTSKTKGILIYNYGDATIKDIEPEQSNIGYNAGTLTMDNVTMKKILQMVDGRWNSYLGGYLNFNNTGNVTIKDSSFELGHSFLNNNGGDVTIRNTTIDRLEDGFNINTGDALARTLQIINNFTSTGVVNIIDSELYHRGTGEILYNKGTVNIEDSKLESNTNNTILNNGGILNVKGDSSVESKSGNYSGVSLTNGSTFTLGESIEIDGEVSQTKPLIKGTTYGVNNTNSTFNFYDGLIEGKTLAVNGITTNIEFGYTPVFDTDGDYKSNYLARIPIVQNITQATASDEKKYYDLKTAFDEASSGDTLKMLANYSNLSIDETAVNDTSITFDLNGKTIRQSNDLLIQNNGTLNITDSSQNSDGNIILLSGTSILVNSGTVILDGGKLSTNVTNITVVTNNTGATLNVKDHVIMESLVATTLIDNSGTTNIYNGTYFRDTRAYAIINRDTLNIIDLNNDDDENTSSTLAAPQFYTENTYNNYISYNPGTIYNVIGATTIMYGGIYNNGSTTSPNGSIIIVNDGTATMKNINSYAFYISHNSGNLTIEKSHFYNSLPIMIASSGTINMKDVVIEISDTYADTRIWSTGIINLDNVQIIKNDDTYRRGNIIRTLGELNMDNSLIDVYIADAIYNENKALIKNSTIDNSGITNIKTLDIDNSIVNGESYAVNNSGTLNIKNNSVLTTSTGTTITTSGTLNVFDTSRIISNGASGITLNDNAILTVGEIGGTPDTDNPYIEGLTYGINRTTQTSTLNFYDGRIVGGSGPNAIAGGITNVEAGYETEDIIDPDTNKHNEYLVVSASSVAVAKVGNYSFAANSFISPSKALQNAVNFAIGDGSNVKNVDLITNIDLVNDGEIITASMPVTINLGGHTINQSSDYYLDSNITLNNGNGLGGSISKLLGDVFDISNNPKNIIVYELSDGSSLDTSKTYKLYRDGKLISLEKEELGRYRYKGNDENLTSIKGRLYLDNLYKGDYKLESSDNKSIEFSIDSDGHITGNVTENNKQSGSSSAIANAEAELILTIQTGNERHYYFLLIIPIIIVLGILIIINKNRKREI